MKKVYIFLAGMLLPGLILSIVRENSILVILNITLFLLDLYLGLKKSKA